MFSIGERTSVFGNPMAKWWGYKWWWARCLLSVFACFICFIRSQWTSNLSSSAGFTRFNIWSPLLFQVPVCQGFYTRLLCRWILVMCIFICLELAQNWTFYSSISAFNVKWLSHLCLQSHGTREGVTWSLLSLLGATLSRDLELDTVIRNEMALKVLKFLLYNIN